MNERKRGHIKEFNHQVRCGLVQPDDGYPDIRVSLSDFRGDVDVSRLALEDTVEFRIEHAPEGPRAVDVVVVNGRPTPERVKGRIKWFSQQKSYGFIKRDDGLRDVFVHRSAFRTRSDAYWVRDGDIVDFKVEQGRKGPRAVDVVLLETR
jgi:CspA family cold shock protein